MAKWYAILCEKEHDGYKPGEVCSYGTVIAGPNELKAKGLRAIDLGEQGERGPDFSKKRFDTVSLSLVDREPEPAPPAQDLLSKKTWTSADQEAAIRLLLERLR